jgi:hypothetical protein
LIPWVGALFLGVLGQGLIALLMALAIRARPFLRNAAVLAFTVLAADVAAVAIGYVAGRGLELLNYGSPYRRGVVSVFAVMSVPAITWATFRAALTVALRRRVDHAGLIPFFGATGLTLVGWTAMILPGVRPSSANRPAEVRRITIALPTLPSGLEGTTILLVSDIHVGRYVSPEEARRRLAPARRLRADLIVCTGDVATYGDQRLRQAIAVLDETMPRGPRYACLGNHERWINERVATEELKAAGFDVLNNENRRVTVRGGELWLAGVNDPHTRADDLKAALDGVPDDWFSILLSHSPDIVNEASARGADLMLSGHTHGGQVVIPLIGPTSGASRYGPRYASGVFRVRGTTMFVTRGVGEVVVPMRMYCDPEIALLTLARPDGNRGDVVSRRQGKSR